MPLTDPSEPLAPSPAEYSPWLTLWRHPHRTLLRISEKQSILSTLLLTVSGALGWEMFWLGITSHGQAEPLARHAVELTLLYSAVSACIWANALEWIDALLLKYTGRWFLEGRAATLGVFHMLAWANLPMTLALVALLMLSPVIGEYWFNLEGQPLPEPQALYLLRMGLFWFYVVAALWALGLKLIGIAAVQRSSLPKALMNWLYAELLRMGLLIGLGILVGLVLSRLGR